MSIGGNTEIKSDLVRFASSGITEPQRTGIRPSEDRRILAVAVAFDTFQGDAGFDLQVGFRGDFVESWRDLAPPGTVAAGNSGVVYALNYEMDASEGGAPASDTETLTIPEPGFEWEEDDELVFLNEHVTGGGQLRLLITVYYAEK